MSRRVRPALLCAIASLSSAPATAQPDSVQAPVLPSWMAGCWQQESGEDWTEECWTIPRAGQMLGSSRSGKAGKTRSWEFMRIVRDLPDGAGQSVPMAFLAAPQGQGWTTFGWSVTSEPGVTFVSAAHDYPQRIRYWREGRLLHAEISPLDGSRAQRWTYSAMTP